MQQKAKTIEEEISEQIGRKYEMPRELNEVPTAVRHFAPKNLRDADTPLQLIAAAITGLTWHDAEEMGRAIGKVLTDGNMTAAIQAWAEAYCHAGTNSEQS